MTALDPTALAPLPGISREGEPVVDLAFPIFGGLIPADHGYLLFAAISRDLPSIHGDEATGVHPIGGRLVGGRRLALTPQSRLTLRLPVVKVRDAIRLAGRRLDLGGASITVGVPTTLALAPAPALASRLVVIRGFMDADAFLDAARRQLAARGVGGTPALEQRRGARLTEGQAGSRAAEVRRTLRIRGREIVGFAVTVRELGPDDSLRLQALGLGGRRRFGCGVFVPASSTEETG